jgi:N-formylglutamate amidohydrolase
MRAASFKPSEALRMEPELLDRACLNPPYEARRPGAHTAALVFNSPHSGRAYPPSLLARSRLDAVAIRRSEDSFVDELFASVTEIGAPLLRAHFPRAYVDVNREPYELDPSMFVDPLPAHANTKSHRVSGGLGTIARVVGDGSEIYCEKLSVREAEWRIRTLYEPYHRVLRSLLDETRRRFGFAILVDCHSMPSVGGPADSDRGLSRPDIVLGDRFAMTAAPAIVDTAEATLRQLGYSVARNNPYAGGFITEHYGKPVRGIHALQIEINRQTYMDEIRVQRGPGFEQVARDMGCLARALASLSHGDLQPPAAA